MKQKKKREIKPRGKSVKNKEGGSEMWKCRKEMEANSNNERDIEEGKGGRRKC